MNQPKEVTERSDILNELSTSTISLVYVWASFHEACSPGGQMDQLLLALLEKYGNTIKTLKCNAEVDSLTDWVEDQGVSMIPSIIFFKRGQKVSLIEGVKPNEIMTQISSLLNDASDTSDLVQEVEKTEDPQENIRRSLEKEKLYDRLRVIINSAKVVVFMKGNTLEPKCKFSRALVDTLKQSSIDFQSFDILQDDEVRQGLKEYSNWNTYPQVYANGCLVGGLDSVNHLKKDGKLVETLTKGIKPTESPVFSKVTAPKGDIESIIRTLISSSKVMLFMKGSPIEPQCGFSRKMVNILREEKISFDYFDILEDLNVREALKRFSNWPTYPQLYVDGNLIGGLDIVEEMVEEGNFKEGLGLESQEDSKDSLKKLINKGKVMLFMKGNPEEPRCGFSRQIVEILKEAKCSFESFDILSDENVRQKLKIYSNWPTYPQLYVNGALLGGLDIVKEMKEDGELEDALMV